MNKLLKSNTSTVIYVTISLVILVIGYISSTLDTGFLASYFIVSGFAFVVLTRKYNILINLLSVFLLLNTIGTLPLSIYEETGAESTFLLGIPLIGFFSTMILSNSSKHPEWSIKSPWLANVFGLVSLNATIILSNFFLNINSQYILGIIGLLSYFLTVTCYLTLGKKVQLNEPEYSKNEELIEKFINEAQKQFKVKSTDNQFEYIVYDDDKKFPAIYKLIFINEFIYKREKSKKKGKIMTFYSKLNLKELNMFPWLFKQNLLLDDLSIPNKYNEYIPVIISTKEIKNESSREIFFVNHNRTKKRFKTGYLTLAKDTNENISSLTKLIVDLSLIENNYL